MGLKPDSTVPEVAGSSSQLLRKERFGAIYYANNGENVDKFDLKIPVTIHYWWGELSEILEVHIDTTHGNENQ